MRNTVPGFFARTIFTACAVIFSTAIFAAPVTFNFTGTVTSSTGVYSTATVGTTVTGTYTFDYANANPAQSAGTVGSLAGWQSQTVGGTQGGAPIPSGLVFSSTAQVGGVSYSTALPGAFYSSSYISGGNGNGFAANEEQAPDSNNATFSSLAISTPGGTAYTSDGLPVYSVGSGSASGSFESDSFGTAATVSFTITSLTKAPASATPTVAPTVMGTQGLDATGNLTGWYVSPVTLSWTVTGTPTPITSGCVTAAITNQTKGKTYTCTATNTLGTASQSVTIKIDTIAPRVLIAAPRNGATYKLNSTHLSSFKCSNSFSGLATCSGSDVFTVIPGYPNGSCAVGPCDIAGLSSGSVLDTSQPGAHSFSVDAWDNAGNSTHKLVNYTVK